MTIKNWMTATVTVVGLAAGTGAALAQTVGETEYMQACAVCHGESALGAGPLSDLMNVDVPSLKTLSQNNDGVFPMLDVIHIIDGRTGLRGHGGVMPVWGDLFESSALAKAGVYGAEMIVRGRVLSIAQYLEGIQE